MKRPNVLVIILDCVRADRMSCYGYHKVSTPNIDRISREATVFENAISVAPWTLPSHASIFTGLYPSEHGATTWDSRLNHGIQTLAETMSNEGYDTTAVCHNDAWISGRTGLARGFRTFFGATEINAYSVFGRYTTILPIASLRGLRSLIDLWNFLIGHEIAALSVSIIENILSEDRDTPKFIFVNLLNAHYPYLQGLPTRSLRTFLDFTKETWARTLVAGERRTSIIRKWKQLATRNEFTQQEFEAFGVLYDRCVRYLDSQLGRLFEFMRRSGSIDETLLMVTADHGENLGDHKLIDHELSVHDSLVRVPLIVRYPKSFPTGKRVLRQVETRTIFNTILDAASISRSGVGLDHSLLRSLDKYGDDDCVFGEYSPSRGLLSRLAMYSPDIDEKERSMRRFVRTRDFKYVKYENGDDELYRLDNGERSVNREEYPQVCETLRDRMASWESSLCTISRGEGVLSEKDQKMVTERLRALGYY